MSKPKNPITQHARLVLDEVVRFEEQLDREIAEAEERTAAIAMAARHARVNL